MESISLVIDILFKIVITGFVVCITRKMINLQEDALNLEDLHNKLAIDSFHLKEKVKKMEIEFEELKNKKGRKK